MKNHIAKKIRTLAQQLPKIQHWILVPEILTGKQVKERFPDKTEIDGKPILDKRFYRCMKPKRETVNHEANLKKIYNERGQDGFAEYSDWVHAEAKRIEREAKSLKAVEENAQAPVQDPQSQDQPSDV